MRMVTANSWINHATKTEFYIWCITVTEKSCPMPSSKLAIDQMKGIFNTKGFW
jgi:hypothetical protein